MAVTNPTTAKPWHHHHHFQLGEFDMEKSANTITTDQFTLARIALVLGRDVREMRRSMTEREPDGSTLVSGNIARTYLISSLPAGVRLEVEQLAERRGYDCPERLVGRDSARWDHPLPIAQIHQEEITKAQRQAGAFANWVLAYSDGTQPLDEIRAGAANAQLRTMGFRVTDETLVNLMRRVIQRDNGRGEFCRWELYLPESPKRRTAKKAKNGTGDYEQFDSYLPSMNVAAPTLEDRTWAWTAMCDQFQALLENQENPRVARRRLIRYVFKCAPWLSASRASLAKCFDLKWERYCKGEKYLADRRPAKSGNHSELPLTEDDKNKLTARALAGGMAKAWRETMQSGDIEGGAVQRYIANPASKTYVPRRVREAISADVEMLQDFHRGPRQAKLKGAYISRDWSGVMPGDWYQADDTTLPLYYYEEDGKGGFHALRGQSLLMSDQKTNRLLTLALHSENNYNATVIRGLILRTHDDYGLPRKGFYFENGIWRKSKLITGSATELPGEFTEMGLREFGVEFKHAKPGNARAKTVERIIGLMQTRMEDQPGYVGRNEQTEKFERVQRKLLLARAGKIEYASFLLHRDEWVSRLAELCDIYNCELQDGRLKGLSPREVWERDFQYDRPLVRLEDESRYILANHRRPYKITKNGIRIQHGKETSWFRNEATGALIGRTVHVYFNPEDMSSIWLQRSTSDMDMSVVPRTSTPPALDATPEEMVEAMASCDAHNRPARTLYAKIATHFPKNGPSPFRRNISSTVFAESTGDLIDRQKQIRAEQGADTRKQKKANRVRRLFGNQPGSDAVSTNRLLAAEQLMKEAQQDANSETEY